MRAGPLSSCWLICLLLAPAGASGSDVTAAAALAEGRCAEAADLAAVEVLEAPDSQAAWRTLGDAQRCIGAARPAVLAYARYLELAGSDPAVEALVSTLRERLGRLRVTVHTDRPAPLRVEAHPEYGDPVVARLQPDGTWLLPDLEPGTRPTIVVRGTGVEEVRTPAPMILVDDEATLTLSPGWKGIGVLGLSARPPAGTTVEALTVDGWTTVPPDSQVRLTAGEQPVVVAGEHGRVGSMVEVPADGRTLFDPVPWEPTLLTVTGAPAGAELRLFLEGTEPPLERIVTLPRNVGEIDGEFGVRVAPPTPIDSVVGGPGSLVLSHPSLGLAASELVLEPGASNRVELDWRRLAQRATAPAADHHRGRGRGSGRRGRRAGSVDHRLDRRGSEQPGAGRRAVVRPGGGRAPRRAGRLARGARRRRPRRARVGRRRRGGGRRGRPRDHPRGGLRPRRARPAGEPRRVEPALIPTRPRAGYW